MTDKPFDQWATADLQKFRAGIDESKLSEQQRAELPALDALIAQKLATDAANKVTKDQRFREQAKRLDKRAKDMYPELKQEDSELAKRTAEYLDEMGVDKATTDPAAFMTAASLAADELKIAPMQFRDTPNPNKMGGGGNKPVAPEGDPDTDELFSRTSKLASLLEAEGVLNMSAEGVKDRIAANHARIREEM